MKDDPYLTSREDSLDITDQIIQLLWFLPVVTLDPRGEKFNSEVEVYPANIYMHECFVLTITHMQCTRLVNSQAYCDDNQWNTPSIKKTK